MRAILIEELCTAFDGLTEKEIDGIVQGFFNEAMRRGIFIEHFSLDEPLTDEKAEAFRAILQGDIHRVINTPDVQPLTKSMAFQALLENVARAATTEYGRGFVAVFLNSSSPDENISFISASKFQQYRSRHKDQGNRIKICMIVWLSGAECMGNQAINGIRITDVVDVPARPAPMSSQYRWVQQHRSAWCAGVSGKFLPILMHQTALWIYMRLPCHKDELTQEQFDGIMDEVQRYDLSSTFLVAFFRSEGVEVVCFRFGQPAKLALSA